MKRTEITLIVLSILLGAAVLTGDFTARADEPDPLALLRARVAVLERKVKHFESRERVWNNAAGTERGLTDSEAHIFEALVALKKRVNMCCPQED